MRIPRYVWLLTILLSACNESPVVPGECGGAFLSVSIGIGVRGAPASGNVEVRCGQRVDYVFTADSGFTGLIVSLDDKVISPHGSVTITGTHSLAASARPLMPLPRNANNAATALRRVLDVADKPTALRAFLQEIGDLTDALSPVESAAIVDSLFQSVIDPVIDKPAILAASAALAGEMYQLRVGAPGEPDVSAFARSRSTMYSATAADERTGIVYVNGILTTWVDAVENAIALKNLGDSYGIQNVEYYLFYNFSKSQYADIMLAACMSGMAEGRKLGLGPFGTQDAAAFEQNARALCSREVNFDAQIADLSQSIRQSFEIAMRRPSQDPEVEQLERALAALLTNGLNLVLVPHSQGNLHVRQALDRLVHLSPADHDRISVASIAPPDLARGGNVSVFNCWTIERDILAFLLPNDPSRCPTGQNNYPYPPGLRTQLSQQEINTSGFIDMILLHSFRGGYLEENTPAAGPRVARQLAAETILRHQTLLNARAPGSSTELCDANIDFDNGTIPTGWNMGVVRSGPGLVNDRLEGHQVDGGAEVGRLESNGIGRDTFIVRYRGNLSPLYWGMWDGIALPMTDGTTWQFTSSTQAFGGGVAPPNRLLGAHHSGIASLEGIAIPGVLSNSHLLFDDRAIPEMGDFNYELTLTLNQIRWVIRRDADGTLVTTHDRAIPGFAPADIRGFAILTYTTTGPAHWIDDVQLRCGTIQP